MRKSKTKNKPQPPAFWAEHERPAHHFNREVHPPQALRRLLDRERCRTERTGRKFALVVCELGPNPPGRSPSDRAVNLLGPTLRLTDELGIDRHDTICLFLPETDEAGAQCVADRAAAALANRGFTDAATTVYVYPTRWFGGEPIQPAGRGERGGHRADGESGHGDPAQSRPADGWGESTLARPITEHSTPNRASSYALETAFAKPMPVWKRVIDLAGAGSLVILGSPLFAIAALTVRLGSRGPIFFTQERSGLGGRPFRMLKFRTMVDGAEQQRDVLVPHNEQDGPAFKMTNDPRVTSVGKVLRKTSLDELPQLINVLRGEMSMVGPRPLPCHESDACEQWHRARLDVTPGITCLWQVNGRSTTNFDRWVRLDLAYVRRRTLMHDLKLIVLTVPAVLLQKGAR